MILSASRRTDIPCYYSEWFFNRIKEGFVCVRNPVNPVQVSSISLSPEVIDCIVFWTKNPQPMLGRLEELAGYDYYFQFTLTGYGKDVEKNIPHKKDTMIPVFQQLSEKIGKERVIWRYDPFLFTPKYTPEYHLRAFSQIAQALCGYTERCVISFVDTYVKNKKELQKLGVYELLEAELRAFVRELSRIAGENGLNLKSCAERIDLEDSGVCHGNCIDKELVERITGCQLKGSRDKNQRPECGCMESVEIGTYNTCLNGCVYCYANHSAGSTAANCQKYDPMSPILCGTVREEDKVTVRAVKSLKVKEK